jgi:hypothetical protein
VDRAASSLVVTFDVVFSWTLEQRPRFVPVGALLIGVRDLQNARFIERYA